MSELTTYTSMIPLIFTLSPRHPSRWLNIEDLGILMSCLNHGHEWVELSFVTLQLNACLSLLIQNRLRLRFLGEALRTTVRTEVKPWILLLLKARLRGHVVSPFTDPTRIPMLHEMSEA